MAKGISPRRYARAVFELALAREELDKWRSDLESIVALGEDAALTAWLESPKVGFKDKALLLADLLKEVNPLALNLTCLLVAKGRLGMADDIADEYQRLFDSYRGIEQAEVTTAVPLENDEKQKLSERLSTVAGKRVVLKAKVDPALIGGIVAKVGGKLLDASTRSRLLALKRKLER